MRKILLSFMAVIALAAAVPSAQAAEFLIPPQKNGSIATSGSQSFKNLYTAGANTSINSNVTGDLFIAGGSITVDGNVQQSLGVAGGNIAINGSVGGSIRAAGGNISISGPVGGDIVIAGGSVNINQRAAVSGDVVAAGGSILIDAPVSGSVRIAGGNITINSNISGSVYVNGGNTLTFGPSANIHGSVYYKGRSQAVIQQGAIVPAVQFEQLSTRSRAAALFSLATLIHFVAIFLAALVLYLLFKTRSATILGRNVASPWKNLGIGIIFAILTPIVAVLLFITFIGYYLGLVLMAIYILVMLAAMLFAIMHIGAQVYAWISGTKTYLIDWRTILFGAVLYIIISWIPIVGAIVLILITMISVGALVSSSWNSRHTVPVETLLTE